jgi:DNA invertase Pin-like site-specific DNA recombinase
MARIGYLRIRPDDPDGDQRADALAAAGCTRVYTDRASGAVADRPQLTEALAHLGPGDELVVAQLADPARSLAHLVGLVADVTASGASVVALAEDINTATTAHRHVLAGLAALDRALGTERAQRGARSPREHKGGRPRTATHDKIATAKAMLATGEHTMDEVAQTVGVSRSTLYRHLGHEN